MTGVQTCALPIFSADFARRNPELAGGMQPDRERLATSGSARMHLVRGLKSAALMRILQLHPLLAGNDDADPGWGRRAWRDAVSLLSRVNRL